MMMMIISRHSNSSQDNHLAKAHNICLTENYRHCCITCQFHRSRHELRRNYIWSSEWSLSLMLFLSNLCKLILLKFKMQYIVVLILCILSSFLFSCMFWLQDLRSGSLFWRTCICVCSLSCLQAAEANSISLSSAFGGAEVSRPSEPPRPLLPPSRPGAPAVLSALRPPHLPGVCRHTTPWPPLLPHPWCYRSPWRPHPRAGHSAAATSPGASKGLTAEGATECFADNCVVGNRLRLQFTLKCPLQPFSSNQGFITSLRNIPPHPCFNTFLSSCWCLAWCWAFWKLVIPHFFFKKQPFFLLTIL